MRTIGANLIGFNTIRVYLTERTLNIREKPLLDIFLLNPKALNKPSVSYLNHHFGISWRQK